MSEFEPKVFYGKGKPDDWMWKSKEGVRWIRKHLMSPLAGESQKTIEEIRRMDALHANPEGPIDLWSMTGLAPVEILQKEMRHKLRNLADASDQEIQETQRNLVRVF